MADVRAATPTAAAELATPVLSETLLAISQLRGRLLQAMTAQIQLDRQRLKQVRESYVFTQPQRLYEGYTQRVAQLTDQLVNAQRQQLAHKNQQFSTVQARLSTHLLTGRLTNGQQQLTSLRHELASASVTAINANKTRLQSLINELDLLSPLKIMTRGYSYVTVDDQVVRSVTQLAKKQAVTLHLADGQASATIDDINKADKEKN